MIYFIGAGPGAADLITVRGMRLLERADLVVYAGSLVNPELLSCCPKGCAVMNSASLQLIPATVCALRASLGCGTPFDILPAVWLTSALALGAGLGTLWLLERVGRKRR